MHAETINANYNNGVNKRISWGKREECKTFNIKFNGRNGILRNEFEHFATLFFYSLKLLFANTSCDIQNESEP